MQHFLVYFLICLLALNLGACKTTRNRDNSPFTPNKELQLNQATARLEAKALPFVSYTDPTLLKRITRFALIKSQDQELPPSSNEALALVGGGKVGPKKAAPGNAMMREAEDGPRDFVVPIEDYTPPHVDGAKQTKLSPRHESSSGSHSDSFTSSEEALSPLISPRQLQKLQQINEITGPEKIRFEPGEDALFLALDRSHPLISAIKSNQDARIIRGSTEYRIVSESDQLSMVNAFDLRPQLKTAEVREKILNGQSFLPEVTFRSDPDFTVKREIAEKLGGVLKEGFIQVGTKKITVPVKRLKAGMKTKIALSSGEMEFEVKRSLGSGSFGEVMLLEFKGVVEGNQKSISLAVKQPLSADFNADFSDIPEKASLKKSSMQEELIREIDFLQAMSRHPNGMQYYGAFSADNKGRYSQVLEVVDGDWGGAKTLSDDELNRIMVSAADGYVAMHASNIVHFDTKPGNLFFQGNHAKLGDFGKALKVEPGIMPALAHHGTYRSPSITSFDWQQTQVKGDPFKEDVFALGLSMLELRARRNMWSELSSCCRSKYENWYVLDGEKFFAHIEVELFSKGIVQAELTLLKRMVSNTPSERPTMEEVASELRTIHRLPTM